MATPKDVQDLLRLLTTGRNKIPMLAAMGRVKDLRNAELHSITTIASSNVQTIQKALPDEKAAKALLAACKASIKKDAEPTSSNTNNKRPLLNPSQTPETKRLKSAYSLPDEPQTPSQREAALRLPQPNKDEEAIEKCVVLTNRAPLLLVFAYVLLGFTMPRQPRSGRLSLAQGVVGVNARWKAESIGLDGASGGGGMEGGGYPKVRVLGRDVAVLKRGGYEWFEEGEEDDIKKEEPTDASASMVKQESPPATNWTVSSPITSKQSTFVARTIPISSPQQAQIHLTTLLSNTPSLTQASHHITAYRLLTPHNGILENSNDDGESGGGKHLLGVLRDSNAVGVLLLVSRWYGGVMLGPDRWRIMSLVARDALALRLRVAGSVGEEALWGLDLSGKDSGTKVGEMAIHQPENARTYILKAFPSADIETEAEVKYEEGGKGKGKKKKKTAKEETLEKEQNLGLLIGALELLCESWVDVLGSEELDRRAWGWYCAVRPEVEAGPAGWGGKGAVRLERILGLRRVVTAEGK